MTIFMTTNYLSVGATISFDAQSYTNNEEDSEVSVCVRIVGVPLGGTEGDITVSLGTIDIGKTGKVLATLSLLHV